MGNRQTRAFVLQQQDAADWEQLRTAARAAAENAHACGIGLRRLQLIVCPSFGESCAWEVRQLEEEWWLFKSRVVAPWPAVQLLGYDPVLFDPIALSSFFKRVVNLTFPISPDLSGMGGLDGTVTQLAVFGDLFSELRFQWWSEPPPHWKPLTKIAAEMLEAFEAGTVS